MSKYQEGLKNLLEACYKAQCPDLSDVVIAYGRARNNSAESVKIAAEKAIKILLKKGVVLANVKEIAVNYYLPEDILTHQVNRASAYLASVFPKGAEIANGAVVDNSSKSTVAIVVIK